MLGFCVLQNLFVVFKFLFAVTDFLKQTMVH